MPHKTSVGAHARVFQGTVLPGNVAICVPFVLSMGRQVVRVAI